MGAVYKFILFFTRTGQSEKQKGHPSLSSDFAYTLDGRFTSGVTSVRWKGDRRQRLDYVT